MCLCEKFEFAGNFRRLFSNDPWGESQHMGPFIECIFALKNVRCWQWNEGGKSKILRQFWTSWALAFRKCKICKCKGQNVHLLHIFIEKQKKLGQSNIKTCSVWMAPTLCNEKHHCFSAQNLKLKQSYTKLKK